MQRQLGRIEIIDWQVRRLRDQPRPSVLPVTLGSVAGLCALLLLFRFVAGFDLPLPLLQAAFAVLVVCCAFLLMRTAVGFFLRLQRR